MREQALSDLQPPSVTAADPGSAPELWEDADAFTDFLTATFREAVQEAVDGLKAKGLLRSR